MQKAETFTLGQMLSITTGRLCCEIGEIYQILNHITGDNLFTHVLPRASRFAEPLLLNDHPELVPAAQCLASLDKWVAADRTPKKSEAVKMWLAELRMMFPEMAKDFVVKSYADSWLSLNPLDELESMRKPQQVTLVAVPEAP